MTSKTQNLRELGAQEKLKVNLTQIPKSSFQHCAGSLGACKVVSTGKRTEKKHSKIPLVLSTHTIFKTHIKTKCSQSLNFRQSQWAIAACMLESPPLLIWSATHEGQCHCQVPQSTCAQEREKGASNGLLTLFLLLGNTCRTTKTWMV